MEKKLYRSNKDRVISGVCGGIAEYFQMDSTIVRLLWVLITLAGGAGFIGYIIFLIVVPERSSNVSTGYDDEYIVEAKHSSYSNKNDNYSSYEEYPEEKNSDKNNLLVGIILIGLGGVFLLKRYVYWFDTKALLPLLLIAVGGYIIFNRRGDK